MHFPLDRNASGPELIFEKVVDRPDNNVLLWYKNADHGANAFCIPYTTRHQVRGKTIELLAPTYPDFIVLFMDGSIGIYEIKDYDKKDDKDVAKALAISETVNRLCKGSYIVHGGLIYVDQQAQVVRDIEKYPELE